MHRYHAILVLAITVLTGCTDAGETTTPPAAELVTAIAVEPAEVAPGGQLTVTVTVSNIGGRDTIITFPSGKQTGFELHDADGRVAFWDAPHTQATSYLRLDAGDAKTRVYHVRLDPGNEESHLAWKAGYDELVAGNYTVTGGLASRSVADWDDVGLIVSE